VLLLHDMIVHLDAVLHVMAEPCPSTFQCAGIISSWCGSQAGVEATLCVASCICGGEQQVARHTHSLRPRFRDLVDLLLGWSLDPQLPDAMRSAARSPCRSAALSPTAYQTAVRLHDPVQSLLTRMEPVLRFLHEEKVLSAHEHGFFRCYHIMSSCVGNRPQMAATFLSLHVVWAEETTFAAQLVRNLVKDMAAVSDGPGQASIAQLRRFLALCNCVAAFAKACGSSLAADIASVQDGREQTGLLHLHAAQQC